MNTTYRGTKRFKYMWFEYINPAKRQTGTTYYE